MKTIGIVGGVGPYAGLDLNEKIFNLTMASRDQDHLNVLLFSLSSQITDRTEFLTGKILQNPADAIYRVISKLEEAGADIVGIPCNTSHAPAIWDEIILKMKNNNRSVTLIHMIEETCKYIQNFFPKAKRIGLLATIGTVKSNVYHTVFSSHNLEIVYPDENIQEKKVHESIYNTDFGIKAYSNPVDDKAKELLISAVNHLIDKGVDAIVLGCTEIPLALKESEIKGIPLIDSTFVLARSLVKIAAPDKLKIR